MIKSIDLLKSYLVDNGIKIEPLEFISCIPEQNTYSSNLETSIFDSIIVDAYDGMNSIVKEISESVFKLYKHHLGRYEKQIIKKALDYNDTTMIDELDNTILEYVKMLIPTFKENRNHIIDKCKNEYLNKLIKSIDGNNYERVRDYLNFMYSKVIYHNEYKYRSVLDIFSENYVYLKKELDEDTLLRLECESKKFSDKQIYTSAISRFNEIYHDLYFENKHLKYSTITYYLDQFLFDRFESYEEFVGYIRTCVIDAYNKLKNHRALVIKIENILSEHINIKWKLYSDITILCENINCYKEDRQYYKPYEIFSDYYEDKYHCVLSTETRKLLKLYYQNKINYEKIKSCLEYEIQKEEIDSFTRISYGFEFIDCYILKSEDNFPNSENIEFIENKNELLLVFYKNKLDERKIPCPVCSSLKISGNSYSALGIKSWECKNRLCSDRSKSNRGKRYSIKSIEMQNSIISKNNHISKSLISKWRRDLVNIKSEYDIFEMIVNYFSYEGDSLLFFNCTQYENYIIKLRTLIRKYVFISNENIESNSKENYLQMYKDYANIKFINRVVFSPRRKKIDTYTEELINNDAKLIQGDCLEYLQNIPNCSISHIVTSPPYYNAREYTQWKNLYSYLNEMYQLCQLSFSALVPGGVFFFNIGDIFDNPNTIVKSTMGGQRIPLGAYLILLFEKSGFVLLDNIIWDKGETQSNRHKNDGIFASYYQRPANCYEHMFIFMKKGALVRIGSEPRITSNVIKFPPVVKINSKGENIFGHTAPYPISLPEMSINTFTIEKDLVFDPYLGSGTSIIAALRNERKATGVEINPNYYELSKKRVTRELFNLYLI